MTQYITTLQSIDITALYTCSDNVIRTAYTRVTLVIVHACETLVVLHTCAITISTHN
jgi:hypothetical protein